MNADKRQLVLLSCAILIILTAAAFWQVGSHDYISSYDDGVYARENPYVAAGLTGQGVAWAFSIESRDYGCNWHPVTWLSLMLDTSLLHPKTAGPMHVVSLLLHIIGVLLLYLVLLAMTSRVWPSLLVAALFAVHPLHVESVAWIAERKDVLSGVFWMLTMLAYVHYARKPSIYMYIIAALFLAVGLMAKPMLVTLPVVLLLLDYWPLGRTAQTGKKPVSPWVIWRGLVVEKLPMLALCAGSSCMTWLAQHGGGAVAPMTLFGPGVRVANALVAMVAYLVKMVVPVNLAVFYPHPEGKLPEWETIGAFVLLAAMTYGAVRLRKKRPYLIVGWLWYVITLIPVIGLVQVGMQAMADRYTYIPLIGIFVAIAWTAYDLTAKPEKTPASHSSQKSKKLPRVEEKVDVPTAFVLPAVLIVLVLAGVTWKQVGYWQNGRVLFEHTVAVTERNSRSYNNLGMEYFTLRDLPKAEESFRKSIDIDPNYVESLNNYGQALYFGGKAAESVPYLRRALSIDPTQLAARSNLALSLSQLGRNDEAIRELEEAVRQRPSYVPVRFNLARTLMKLGRHEEALAHFREVIRQQPGHADSIANIARIGSISKDARLRNGPEALRLATEVCGADTRPNIFHLQALASSYAEVGRYQDAANAAKQAVDAAQAQENPALAAQMQKELDLYARRRPYRE